MPRIPVHTLESAPEGSRAELTALKRQFGTVLNTFGEMAHAPIVLQSYLSMRQVIEDYGTFDAKTREAIALAVGNADGCAYCQGAHTSGGKAAGWSDEEMLAIRRGDVSWDPKLDALLALARACTLNVGHVPDETWKAAVDSGWSDEELTELFTHVGLNLFTNYFNHFVQTELDIPAAPAL